MLVVTTSIPSMDHVAGWSPALSLRAARQPCQAKGWVRPPHLPGSWPTGFVLTCVERSTCNGGWLHSLVSAIHSLEAHVSTSAGWPRDGMAFSPRHILAQFLTPWGQRFQMRHAPHPNSIIAACAYMRCPGWWMHIRVRWLWHAAETAWYCAGRRCRDSSPLPWARKWTLGALEKADPAAGRFTALCQRQWEVVHFSGSQWLCWYARGERDSISSREVYYSRSDLSHSVPYWDDGLLSRGSTSN